MKHIIFFLLFPVFAYSQGGTWPVKYNDSDPSGAPSASGTRLHFNTATNTLWFWEPAPSSQWRKQPKAFDQISGCAAPAYTPTARQSTFAVNSCTPPELYQYTGSAWECLNCVDGLTLTAGAGITLSGTVPDITISANDASATNELNTSLSVTSGNLRLTDAGGNLDVPVSSIAPVQAVAAGAGISLSGTTTRTITNTAPDQTVVLNNGDGISATGTYPNFTIASTITQADGSETKINVGTGLSKSGSGTTGSPYVLTNTAPDQTVAISAGTGIGVSGTYPDFTVTNSAPGGDNIYTVDGALQATRTIDFDGNQLLFRGGIFDYAYEDGDYTNQLVLNAGETAFSVEDGGTRQISSFAADPTEMQFYHKGADLKVTTLTISDTGPVVSSNITGFEGIKYAAYYPDIETKPQSVTDVQTVQSIVGKKAFNANYTATGTATTAFTVTLPTTQPDATYSVSIMPKNALSATGWYISARTTNDFTVTYLTALTGAVDFDYIVVN